MAFPFNIFPAKSRETNPLKMAFPFNIFPAKSRETIPVSGCAQVLRHLVGGLLHHRNGDGQTALGRFGRLQSSGSHL